MAIKHIHHYSMENPGSIFDEEALTALELAGRTASKVNECVTVVNNLSDEVDEHKKEVGERLSNQYERITNLFEEMPKEVERVAVAQIQAGALDGAVQEYATDIGKRLDTVIEGIQQDADSYAEVVDARTGNGGVTYENLGEAVREQTTNIKPCRLSPNGGEWKADKPLTPKIETGVYYAQSGFNITNGSSSVINSSIYTVKGGTEYLFTCGQDIKDSEITGGFIIFKNAEGQALVGATNLGKFITKVDTKNHVYRIKTPNGCTQLVNRYHITKTPELWEVSQTTGLEWLRVDGDNVEPGTITPAHIYRGANHTYYRRVEYTRQLHCYRQVLGDTIGIQSTNGMSSLCVSDVFPGQVYRIPIGKDVSTSISNYFCFSKKDGRSAVHSSEMSKYVECANLDNFIYLVTIPEGCDKFYISFDMTEQPQIMEVVGEKAVLPWLKVTQENIEPGLMGGGNTYQYLNLPYIYNQIGSFNGKTIHVYGDSITAGVCSPNLETGVSPLAHFASWSGATLVNKSVSGATLSDVANTINNVTSFDGVDVVFICAGINDYIRCRTLGNYGDSADTDTVYGSLKKITSKMVSLGVTTNNAPMIVFITPIGYCGDDVNNPNTLEEYRCAIFTSALCTSTMFTIIDGGNLGFPTVYNELAEQVITDGLHPTNLGQVLYAVNLRNILPM